MFSKVNIVSIISDHLNTLKSIRDGRVLIGDYILFFGIPLLTAMLLWYFDVLLDKDKIDIFIQSLSILAGFSFNLLAVIFGFMDKLKSKIENSKNGDLKKVYLKEIHSNVSFNILTAIVAILTLFVLSFFIDKKCCLICILEHELFVCVHKILHLISYFLLGVYMLTLLMILKRVNILFRNEF